MEYKQKDIVLFSALRKDSRMSLTNISKETRIPVSTVYEKLRNYAGNVIQKYTVLLDFRKLGYSIRITVVLKAMQRDRIMEFLQGNVHVNNAYRINNGYDVMCEGIFKDIHSAESFIQSLEEYGVSKMEVFYILDDVKREGFFAEPFFA